MQFGFMPGRGTTCYFHPEANAGEVSWQKEESFCTLLLLTWKKPLIEFQEMLSGGHCVS